METKKLTGIISSILIIFNYIGNVIIDLFVQNSIQLIEFNATVGKLIFTISMIGFYYSLSEYLKLYNYRTEVKLLISLIILEFISFISNVIQFYYGMIPVFTISIFIAAVVLFVVFGIRILKLKDELFMNLKNLKIFVKSMFITIGLLHISAAFLAFNNRFELMNVTFSIFAIPYIFGLIYFLKDKEKEKQPAVNNV